MERGYLLADTIKMKTKRRYNKVAARETRRRNRILGYENLKRRVSRGQSPMYYGINKSWKIPTDTQQKNIKVHNKDECSNTNNKNV